MWFSDKDKILIKKLCMNQKGTGVRRQKKLIKEFPLKSWSKRELSCMQRRQIHSVDELKRQLIDVSCGLEQSIFDEATDQWRGRL